jgi:hypothetical protein
LQASVPAKQLVRLRNALTLHGATVRLESESSAYVTTKVNGATVVRRDILASNGVLHEVDGVLQPPDRVDSHSDGKAPNKVDGKRDKKAGRKRGVASPKGVKAGDDSGAAAGGDSG